MSRRACVLLLASLALLLPGSGARLDAALIAPVPSPTNESRMLAPGMFLVATRSFLDPDFSGTVVYLLQHDTHATFGVIVNRPLSARLSKWLPDLEGTTLASLTPYDGGPVNPELILALVENRAWADNYDAGLVRHVLDGIFYSVNPVIFERLLYEHVRPFERVRFYIGHIGWVPGQLEREIEHHYWHLTTGNVEEVFGPEAGSLWQRLIDRLEPADSLLSPEVPLTPGSDK